ncbi:MAG: flavodoxin domain-containing protein, partial [Chloroflexi bacterium]|nr:flavodoxin domain-containing protein [Chloroflexota bacterium]
LAHQIGDDGAANGFAATIAPLADYTGKLPTEGMVAIVAASYNGTPPDNARKFCDWLTGGNLSAQALQGVRYALFGCGNRDWAATYQAIPRMIDQKLSDYSATRIGPRGEGNAAADFDGDFQGWYQPFWTTTAETLKLDLGAAPEAEKGPLYKIEVIDERHPNPFVASFGARPMVIIENRELQSQSSERSTRHIELALPEGVTYQTGEHLGVIAQNHPELVRRVSAHFGFNEQTRIKIRQNGQGKTNFPLDQAISVFRLLATYVELQDVATRKQIKTLADFTSTPMDKQRLLALAGDDEASKT